MRRLKTRVGKGGSAHVVEVYQVVRMEKKELCASNYQLQVYLEYCPLSLTAAIAGRLKERRNFSEAELFTFLARAVDSLLYMQDNGLKNIQLDGDAIFMVNDGVKILDSTIATSKSYYQLLDAQTQ